MSTREPAKEETQSCTAARNRRPALHGHHREGRSQEDSAPRGSGAARLWGSPLADVGRRAGVPGSAGAGKGEEARGPVLGPPDGS